MQFCFFLPGCDVQQPSTATAAWLAAQAAACQNSQSMLSKKWTEHRFPSIHLQKQELLGCKQVLAVIFNILVSHRSMAKQQQECIT